MEEITIEDFVKLDLRVAKIVSAESVEDADKLIKLKLDLGDLGTKIVFAGIKKVYKRKNINVECIYELNQVIFI